MKKLKLVLLLLIAIAFTSTAQETIKEKLKRKLEEAKNQKIDKTIDRALGKSEEKIDKTVNGVIDGDGEEKDKEKKKKNNKEKDTEVKSANPTEVTQAAKITATSKFDFISGEKVLYYDDFSNTAIGDFPTGWNTNSSAELVNITGSNDKWLSITKDGYFQPMAITDMAENFTLEFNVFSRYQSSNILNYKFMIAASDNPRGDITKNYLPNAFSFSWNGLSGKASFNITEKNEAVGGNDGIKVSDLESKSAEYDIPVMAKFSIWRQKSRLRIYINENKVADIPLALDPKQKYNLFKIGAQYMNYSNSLENKDEFMISNLRYAVGAPDTRSKLITEGKLVTRGILFDINSDQIKPESNGVLKDIANILTENPTVKVKIIGHTDSDGEASLNLDLSKRRAAAVKNTLSQIFGIDASRFETDGKGAAEPSEPNTTPQGKANNRRVEFIKL
jgi:outer membrane protein OmpA-like peptidoglycan-associated protein